MLASSKSRPPPAGPVARAEARSIVNFASGGAYGQAVMLPFVDLAPHYSFILPKRKLSTNVLGHAFGLAESSALVSAPSSAVGFLGAVGRALKRLPSHEPTLVI